MTKRKDYEKEYNKIIKRYTKEYNKKNKGHKMAKKFKFDRTFWTGLTCTVVGAAVMFLTLKNCSGDKNKSQDDSAKWKAMYENCANDKAKVVTQPAVVFDTLVVKGDSLVKGQNQTNVIIVKQENSPYGKVIVNQGNAQNGSGRQIVNPATPAQSAKRAEKNVKKGTKHVQEPASAPRVAAKPDTVKIKQACDSLVITKTTKRTYTITVEKIR